MGFSGMIPFSRKGPLAPERVGCPRLAEPSVDGTVMVSEATPSDQRGARSMGGITIEFDDPVQDDPCPCCGGRTTRLTRFVYSNSDAHAVYYASFSDKHPDRWVSVAV